MYSEIAAAYATLKAMGEITSLLVSTKQSSAVAEKAIELQNAIIALQSSLFLIQTQNQDLLTQNNELKQRINDMENWEKEKRGYALKEIAFRVYVYTLKKTKNPDEPSPWFCTNCYDKRQTSIIQRGDQTERGTFYHCPNCKTTIIDHSDYIATSW